MDQVEQIVDRTFEEFAAEADWPLVVIVECPEGHRAAAVHTAQILTSDGESYADLGRDAEAEDCETVITPDSFDSDGPVAERIGKMAGKRVERNWVVRSREADQHLLDLADVLVEVDGLDGPINAYKLQIDGLGEDVYRVPFDGLERGRSALEE